MTHRPCAGNWNNSHDVSLRENANPAVALRLQAARPVAAVTELWSSGGSATHMELVDYKTFSKLRLADFLPPSTEVFSSTGLECCSSHCSDYYEMVGDSYFVFADDSAKEVVEISVDETDPAIPQGTSERILAAMRLPLHLGMTCDEVAGILGPPEYEGSERLFTRYIVGTKSPYRVGCGIAPNRGLWSLWVVREDFFLDDD